MSATPLSAGKDILAYCNKCRLTLAHVIMAMSDEFKIHKVQCKTCQSIHAYKEGPTTAPKKSSSSKSSGKGGGKSNIPGRKGPSTWSEKIVLMASFLPYSLKQQYHIGEGIQHPTFGNGIVEELFEQDKMAVLFEDCTKILMHNKNS